ncbi:MULTISPECIES: OprD family porin [Burkholderia]|uniref:OprD family porin n=1 Tax=Burkholderia TaxID=32008 RepID=UPI0003131D45|nr:MULTISPECIES: OprD family porin [Burkholderia]EKS9844411.1 OprD family porin [Burkholderia cepacia]BEV50596.1 OprD family porin [Burkholderia contaminans]MBJ9671942.1 OprD family porin [Burkholderia cenocepacia]MBJ9878089.1 OprD family porin [Burkholderia cenocepacia]MBJ9924383.1 OprD family porin [Burkholderia cenocepacia]
MKKQKTIGTASKMLLAWGLPALAGVSLTGVAHADDAASAPLTVAQAAPAAGSGASVAQATTPNAIVNAEASQAVTPPDEPSAQSKSNGFIADSHLDFLFRNYADVLDNKGGPHRHAWVQGAMANFESGYTTGLIGIGFDASLYAALKLDGGQGAGSMVHIAKGGGGGNQLAWAYPGIYDVKARISNTVVKYGLQAVDNPFMEQHDNRALPPTFLGATLVSNEFKNVMLEAGSFTKTDARGHTTLTNLTTQYGGTRINRLTYVGGTWDYSPNGEVALYANQADDVWHQYYASVKHSIGSPQTIKWTGFGNVYSTHDTGDALQGKINNNAYSLSLAAQHGPHELLLGFQQVLGDQFFDYLNETNGIFLANSMDVDYNAPHEKSLQLRYTFYGKDAGLPGFKAMVWGVTGWGADGSAGAANDPSKSSIYWSNGAPVQGRHHEFGFIPSYTFQSGKLKNTKVTFIAMWHAGSAHYSDATNTEYRLVVNLPLHAF